ncbi:hypothetical protein TDB9533_03990 [Thalassocella blandensis]|nr:hypothetical protein TDB9533_03990 [Thalassocella blandensis]
MTEAEIIKAISQRLQAERLRLNLSQHALADKAGVSRRTIVQAETGHNTSVATLVRLLIALDAVSLLEPLTANPDEGPDAVIKSDGKKRRRASKPRNPRPPEPQQHQPPTASSSFM